MLQNPLVLAAIGGLLIAGAIVANGVLWDDENDPAPVVKTEQETPAPTPATPAEWLATQKLPNPAKETGPAAVASVSPQADPKPEQAAQPQPEAPVAPAPQAETVAPPTFDVVRITPEGDAVVAGRAFPGSTVTILDNGVSVGQLETDTHGEWVFVPEKPFAPGTRQLALEMRVGKNAPVPSDDVVVLVVPEPKMAAVTPAQQKPVQTLAVKMPKKGGASTVLQRPAAIPGEIILSVDTVDYDEAGRLMISGAATPKMSVYVYLNNKITGKAVAGTDGTWRMQPDQRVQPGLYTLRADQVTPDGKVQARISMPFSRAEPMEDMPSEPFIIVQPGNSLWRIARKTYGSGVGFTTIYEANKSQISDPDLIFPGQVFALPSNTL